MLILYENPKLIKCAGMMSLNPKMRGGLGKRRIDEVAKVVAINYNGTTFMVILFGLNGCIINTVKMLIFGLQ